MENEIKPDGADSYEESESEDYDLLSSDLFKEGDTNDDENSALTLEEIELIAGRKFNSKEDFTKHYTNLKSFVGKTKPDAKKPDKKDSISDEKDSILNGVLNELQTIKQQNAERDFLQETPMAKANISFIRDIAKARGITLNEAWNQDDIKDMIISAEEYKKGREIGINSKTRISPTTSKLNKQLVERAKNKDLEATDEITAKFLKSSGL